MIRKWLTKYLLVVKILLLLVGVILILISTITTKESRLNTALFSLGIVVMASTFISLLNSAFGTDIPTLVEQRLDFKRRVFDIGLETIHLSIGDESIFNRFENARSIDMMYNTCRSTLTRYSGRIIDAIVKKGCTVRILISNPDSDIWKSNEVKDGLCPGIDTPSEVNEVISFLKFQVNLLKNIKPTLKIGYIEVRKYSCVPTCSILIVDGEIVRHIAYLPYAHSSQVPVYEISKERGGELFTHYQNTFNRVWEKSTSIIKADFSSNEFLE